MSDNTASSTTRRINWPLLIGGGLVILTLILAVLGPTLAPKDPREHNLIIQVDGEWMTPPYPAFTPGFPLGSDNLGRDLFSWLLWSVRPTMILILIVALLRMALGVIVGVTAGWSDRWAGRLADGLISSALAVPALIAALIVITALGFRLGVWAFIVGLSVTGWAETAQLVREQTRTVKGQQAVEAAHALGASGAQIFLLHILPQVMPMVWMLLAFEVSSTLVTSAGLGFLGYYLGGAVFTEVDDFVYQRISEMPELGQMLATAWMVLDEPWAMVAAGTVVFLIVLAFNLVGEGLQSRLTRKLGGARKIYLHLAGGLTPWIDEHLVVPATHLIQQPAVRITALVMAVALAGGGALWLRNQQPTTGPGLGEAPGDAATAIPTAAVSNGETEGAATTETNDTPPSSAFDVPGGHIWANAAHDPWRSQWVDFTGPITNTEQWTFEIDGSLTGGPVIDSEGVLYIAGRRASDDGDAGVVYALDPQGTTRWETTLTGRPVGSPALAADGTIYVSEKEGLSALSPDGERLWHFTPDDGEPAMDGPIVSPEGTIYYKSLSGLVAVNAGGDLRWHAPITKTMTAMIPHINAAGDVVYWGNAAFSADTGTPYTTGMPSTVRGHPLVQTLTGADGETYYQYDVVLAKANADAPSSTEGENDEGPIATVVFDWSPHTWQGTDAGVTPGGRPWLQARPDVGGMGLGFYWGTPEGEISSKLSEINMRDARVISVDAHDTAYICMDSYRTDPRCLAFSPDSDSALWRINFRGVEAIAGAALAPGRLYVATWDGTLTAFGEAAASSDAESDTEESGEAAAETFPEALTFGPEPVWDQPEIPGEHLWPMPRRDAWATFWTPVRGPAQAVQRWVLEAPDGTYSGGPVIAADGTLYIGTDAGKLLAVTPEGKIAWQASLTGPAVGSPAIGPDGTIYATDEQAYLSAFTPEGKVQWRYHATGVITETLRAQSGAIIRETQIPLDALGPAGSGPTVAPDGTIYYSMAVETRRHEANVFFNSEVRLAVSPEGEGLLTPPSFTWSDREPPRLSIDNHWTIWSDLYLAPTPATDSELLQRSPYMDYLRQRFEEAQQSGDAPAIRLVNGADGRAYFLEGRSLDAWYLTQENLAFSRTFSWDAEALPGTAKRAGATANGLRWISFLSGRFIWITEDDEIIGPVRFPLESSVIALDGDDAAYGCGSSLGRAPACMKYTQESGEEEPVWIVTLAEDDTVLGGALAPELLYAATDGGRLYALGPPD
jgi:ABC-type dipeptide/oligopeptide/nickel transport system permease subunit